MNEVIYDNITPGDIFWCTIVEYGNKKNRPCIILKKLKHNKVEILPITSIKSKNNLTHINMSFIDCCSALGGFINNTVYVTDLKHCVIGNICNCSINNNLKVLLTLKGIQFSK